jgi:ParB/Sulfiredoxin domain
MAKTLEAETKLEYINQELLDFDPGNPRFGGLMKGRKQPEIQKALFEAPYYASELVDSLLKNGFIDYEPLVVKRKGERFIVVEGNRRLAAIQTILAHPELYHGKTDDLKRIPALVFPDKPDDQQQNEMRVYLGVRHLLGFREWPPLSKALFLEHESTQPGGLERVFAETQLKREEARRFLIPYRLFQHAGVTLPEGGNFWTLGEALGRTGIKKYIQLDIDSKTLRIRDYNKKHLGLLLDNIYGPKQRDGGRDASKRIVDDTRDLSRLGKVLGSEKATAALRAGRTLEEAEILVDTREESVKRLAKVTKELNVLLKQLQVGSADGECVRLLKAFKEFEAAVRAFASKESK